MPGLGIHRGRRTLGDFDNLLENGARHGLVLETTYASARLYQRLEIHSLHLHVSSATGAAFWPGNSFLPTLEAGSGRYGGYFIKEIRLGNLITRRIRGPIQGCPDWERAS
jgi:hypothetical protein